MPSLVKIIVYCPPEAEDELLAHLANMGCGSLGSYDSWSISLRGVERFRPLDGAHPYRGAVGEMATENSCRIEVQCPTARWKEVVKKITELHPYELPAIEVIPLLYP